MKLTFPKFFLRCFSPYLLILLPSILVFGWGGLINISISGISTSYSGGFLTGLICLGVLVLQWGAIVLSWWIIMRLSHFLPIALILYATQFLILLLPAALLAVSLGGMSMAAVDNGGMGRGSYADIASGLVQLFLFAQIFMIPWTLVAIMNLKPWLTRAKV